MKKKKVAKTEKTMWFFTILTGIIILGSILYMQTQIAVLNRELSNNVIQLEKSVNNNQYLEMEISESLTRDKISVFAKENGLTESASHIVELPKEQGVE